MRRIRHRLAETHRDRNEPELIAAAERCGARLYPGPPLDGWLLHRGLWVAPVEIKMPEREGQVHEYTPAQRRFFTWCETYGAPHFTWRTVTDVLRKLGMRAST